MKIIYDKIFLEHETGAHPENKKRLLAFGELPLSKTESAERFLELVHTPAHIEQVRQACMQSLPLDADTLTSPGSFNAALHAAGAAIAASQSNDFALVRPPGHHAHATYSSGFCLFNSIAIATQKLVKGGKRVFILDIDGHLGDGTLDIFYRTDKVLFCSLHQYPAYPGGGFVNEIGEEKGKGYSVNVPLPPGSGDDVFMHALNAVMPIAKQFAPDVVAVSAGFDAYRQDPLLQLGLSMSCFYEAGKILRENFKNVFAVLEGGYNTAYLPSCVHNFIAGINNEPIPYPEPGTTSEAAVISEYENRMKLLFRQLSPYWKAEEKNFLISKKK